MKKIKIDYLQETLYYEKLDNGDYFDMLYWREVSLDTWSKYNNKKRAVMCCIFK